MKIFDVRHFVDSMDNTLNESISLSDLRKKVISGDIVSDKDEIAWYRRNKNSLIDVMSMIVGPNHDKMLNRELKSFETAPYYEKGVIKPKTLKNALEKRIIAYKARQEFNVCKTTISDQYEMITIGNGIELYAVYTPQANVFIAHNVANCSQEPTWCIASPSSSCKFWGTYKLWSADYPCVFIVRKPGVSKVRVTHNKFGTVTKDDGTVAYEKIKNMSWELKCNPKKSWDFYRGYITLARYIDEWRNPSQTERTSKDTTLFEVTGLTPKELYEGMMSLVKSEKAKNFSVKYGSSSYDRLEIDIKNSKKKEMLPHLTKACQMGCFDKFWKKVSVGDEEFIIERLIEYGTLMENNLLNFSHSIRNKELIEKAINFLMKHKRCTHNSLKLAWDRLHDKNLMRRIFYTLETFCIDNEVLKYLIKADLKDLYEDVFKVLVKDKKINLEPTAILFLEAKEEVYFKKIMRILFNKDSFSSYLLGRLLEHGQKQYFSMVYKKIEAAGDLRSYTLRELIKYKANPKYIIQTIDKISENLRGIYLESDFSDALGTIVEYASPRKKMDYANHIFNILIKREIYSESILRVLKRYDKTDLFTTYLDKIIDNNKVDRRVFEEVVRWKMKDYYKRTFETYIKNANKDSLKGFYYDFKTLVDNKLYEYLPLFLDFYIDENYKTEIAEFYSDSIFMIVYKHISDEYRDKFIDFLIEKRLTKDNFASFDSLNIILKIRPELRKKVLDIIATKTDSYTFDYRCESLFDILSEKEMDYLIDKIIENKKMNSRVIRKLVEKNKLTESRKKKCIMAYVNDIKDPDEMSSEMLCNVLSYGDKDSIKKIIDKMIECDSVSMKTLYYIDEKTGTEYFEPIIKNLVKRRIVSNETLKYAIKTGNRKLVAYVLEAIITAEDSDTATASIIFEYGDEKIMKRLIDVMTQYSVGNNLIRIASYYINDDELINKTIYYIINKLRENNLFDNKTLYAVTYSNRNENIGIVLDELIKDEKVDFNSLSILCGEGEGEYIKKTLKYLIKTGNVNDYVLKISMVYGYMDETKAILRIMKKSNLIDIGIVELISKFERRDEIMRYLESL